MIIMEKKNIVLNDASIIDLKAELARKEETSRKRHSDETVSKGGKKTLEKLALLSSRKKTTKYAGVSQIKEPIIEADESTQLEKQLEESKQKLHSKSKLYNKIQQGEVYDDEDEDTGETKYLVDFNKKYIADEQWKDVTEKDEWVEFTDSFGRQRKCQRKDLNQFKSLDGDLVVHDHSFKSKLASAEAAHIEEMHKKWDKEEDELSSRASADLHYEDVKFDEVRQLGVGHFKFSKDEERRKEEMELLNNLREKTLDQRTRHAQLEQKRKDMMKARIEKIKQRKAAKLGTITVTTPANTESNIKDDINITPNQPTEMLTAETTKDDDATHVASSVTKSKPTPYQLFLEKQRKERIRDFSPPQMYSKDSFTDTNHLQATNVQSNKQSTQSHTVKPSISDEIDSFLSQCRS